MPRLDNFFAPYFLAPSRLRDAPLGRPVFAGARPKPD
jgi:hypothetical protein